MIMRSDQAIERKRKGRGGRRGRSEEKEGELAGVGGYALAADQFRATKFVYFLDLIFPTGIGGSGSSSDWLAGST